MSILSLVTVDGGSAGTDARGGQSSDHPNREAQRSPPTNHPEPISILLHVSLRLRERSQPSRTKLGADCVWLWAVVAVSSRSPAGCLARLARPMRLHEFRARILVNGVAAQELQVVREGANRVVCYIASESRKVGLPDPRLSSSSPPSELT